jgi:hypothetical protein
MSTLFSEKKLKKPGLIPIHLLTAKGLKSTESVRTVPFLLANQRLIPYISGIFI